MATKDNFMKALKELTGFDEENGDPAAQPANVTAASGPEVQVAATAPAPVRITIPVPEPVTAKVVANDILEAAKPLDVSDVTKITPIAPLVVEKPHIAYDVAAVRSDVTQITENMVVIGNIRSKDRIDVIGRVRGDVETADDIVVEGVVEGGLKGKNMLLQGSALKGNVLASGDVSIEVGSVVVGNVQAENVKLDGKVKGNLFVAEMTQLTANALILGDIETTGIASSIGSRIRGSIVTKQLDNVSEDIDFDVEV